MYKEDNTEENTASTVPTIVCCVLVWMLEREEINGRFAW